MLLYHLWLLIQKSLRYAWRRRICRCCPKIIFELFEPLICLLFLILLRWIHTSNTSNNTAPSYNRNKPTDIQILPPSINNEIESIFVFNYTPKFQCPSSNILIEIDDLNLFNSFNSSCPKSSFILSSEGITGQILLNTSSIGHTIYYRCRFDNSQWCQNLTQLNDEQHRLQVQHPSSNLCVQLDLKESKQLIRTYLAIESLLKPPNQKLPNQKPPKQNQTLSIYTWPCLSYASDPLFGYAPNFVLIIIFILIDGSILFAFNLLFHSLIEEKSQGITELLRLISIRPILNSVAWFLRIFSIQLIISILLIIILKKSFDGGIYLSYVSIWLIIPTIIFWTIQVLSRSVLVAHFFTSNLKATLWSWFIYFISFWLACSSSIRLPTILHLMASAWLPFYSIKRLIILLFRINTDLGRSTSLTTEIISIWLSILIGSLLMWLLAYYLEQILPGKYGIPQPWTWPLDYIRSNRVKNKKRRESVAMQMVESSPNPNTTVRVNNLTKTYGNFNTEQQLAVDHVSFTLEKSTIHGLIGHNGAGKTSTMEMMCGLLSCDCGNIEIHDKDLYENLGEIQKCIGYCPQQDMLFSHLTVYEQLEFYARVRSKENQIDSKQIEELLKMMDMYIYKQRLCHTLSGGMQRKLSILCAFVGHANVILLDEPSSSLDPVARRVLWSWLRANKTDRTLLISSHLLDEVEELCDSVIILDSGKIRDQGTILELKRKYGPPGDRLHLEKLPDYIPNEWIIDADTHFIQIPDRKQLINLLKKLDEDNIKYSLENITLDDIFLQLTSTTESLSSEENTTQSQINTLFQARTNTERTHLWSQQILGVLIRRGQVFLRRARLLPLVILLYLAYALTPLYMPAFTPSSSSISSTEQIRYIISSPKELIKNLPLKNFDIKYTRSFYSAQEFEKYLLNTQTWPSDHHRFKKLIGLRIPSYNKLECYVPSPIVPNIITACLPIYALIANRTSIPFQLIDKDNKNPLMQYTALSMFKQDPIYYCFYTLPPRFHLSIVLLSCILIICAALTIQDYASGLHSYSIINGIRPVIHWTITLLSDLVLCLIWLAILILIERFVHSSTFNGQFSALTPLFFIANLPFIYLLAKCFKAPIIGATVIIFILQFTHFLFIFRVIIEVFRSYRAISATIRILRWTLILIFPNINIFTLIVAILRPKFCPLDDSLLKSQEEFSDERYSHKILIHILIFFGQFLIYSILLILMDTWKFSLTNRSIKGTINKQEEDDDVANERNRINSMNEENKQHETLIVNNLSKRYSWRSIPAVNRLTFAVPHRQCFGLLGFNGSGKTTTFRMLVGELQPTSGFIWKSNKESIGYCPQDDISFSALTVLQSIDYICRIHGLKPSLLNNLILSQFQLERYRNRLVSNLSGGSRRRLHLALCLIGSPTLLLLDEPTAKIDPLLRSHIRLILQHRPIDTSIVFASHSMLECEQLCNRLTILVHGNARCLGSPQHLKTKYSTDYRIRLTKLQKSFNIESLKCVDNSNEYIYPKTSLSDLFQLLENLVEQNIIEHNYTVQLTSLEHIFLGFQHPIDNIV